MFEKVFEKWRLHRSREGSLSASLVPILTDVIMRMRARAVLAVALALTAERVRGQGIGVGGLKAAVHQAALEKRGLANPQGDDIDPVHDKERCCTVAAPLPCRRPRLVHAPCACMRLLRPVKPLACEC